jgi:hypothetical protein
VVILRTDAACSRNSALAYTDLAAQLHLFPGRRVIGSLSERADADPNQAEHRHVMDEIGERESHGQKCSCFASAASSWRYASSAARM